MDAKTRKHLPERTMLHLKADINLLYLPCKEAGRGYIELENYKFTMYISLEQYLEKVADWMMKYKIIQKKYSDM